MTNRTALDIAHAAMMAKDSPTTRMRFHERLADSELFLLLAREPSGENLDPVLIETETGPYVIAFDRQERLAEFTGATAPYAALSGRVLVAMLKQQQIGIALNPEVAPSAWLIPPNAIDWLAETLSVEPGETSARAESFSAPAGLPASLLSGLDAKLASAAGLAKSAWLAGVRYKDGQQGHILVFVDARPGAEAALAKAVNEAVAFSGMDGGKFDVAFFHASDPLIAALSRVGLRFDLPQPEAGAIKPVRPGSDPEKPPNLR